METVLRLMADATSGTRFEGRIWLVGGALRDRSLGLGGSSDIDLVVEESAEQLADLLFERGVCDHPPALFPRFGTVKVGLAGADVELVTARAESYDGKTRKPIVQPASLEADVLRRDFTINTLVENLHTQEVRDVTGLAFSDLKDGIIRTPTDPRITFHDDPLRMLRAVRFAVRFGFHIEQSTWDGLVECAPRLNLLGTEKEVVAGERIREEFNKILLDARAAEGIELLRTSGVLRQFAPELLEMVGVTQNDWHHLNVWDHTLLAVRNLPAEADLVVRLGVLLHDAAKPRTRSEDAKGVHFYDHQTVGEGMARALMHRLRYSNDDIDEVATLVRLHMRLGEAKSDWSDAAIRRLIRDVGVHRENLTTIARADISAMRPDIPVADLDALAARMADIEARQNVTKMESPLDGIEIKAVLGIPDCPDVGAAKRFLLDEVIEGRLGVGDKLPAEAALKRWWAKR